MKYSRSLTSVVVFRPDASRGAVIQGGAKIGHGGSPSSGNFSLQSGRLSATNRMHSSDLETSWEEVLLFLVPFRSQIFDAFLTSFWT